MISIVKKHCRPCERLNKMYSSTPVYVLQPRYLTVPEVRFTLPILSGANVRQARYP